MHNTLSAIRQELEGKDSCVTELEGEVAKLQSKADQQGALMDDLDKVWIKL